MEDNRQLQEQMGECRRELDLFMQQDRQRRDEETDALSRDRSGPEGRTKEVRREASYCSAKTNQLQAWKDAPQDQNLEERKNQPHPQ
ncbi:hypothetical protein SKAU_G00281590 [Synaphobranchus kaupii]|uniref:Uncharacterized protein n=1 Tax=Synaphobranchus kaupii TaxID=118154 RepID=A0A9Q1EX55_SYNKA|nr:hypothetical protein SKAU_G00281590 [Synaphobranchus kaupii]